jgi:uncharacterized membrane protein
MPNDWERALDRWRTADLIDAATAERIRQFELQSAGSSKLRWPAIVALVFGGLMLTAGLLLFVAAHWDTLSPAQRFALVVLMVGVLHLAGAFAADRMDALAITLHGIGTASLGAGIFLAGQIFNLQAHWPIGVLLWALGAWVGWVIRRDWLQFAFAALLTPFWLAGEWTESLPNEGRQPFTVLLEGLLLTALVYFSARTREYDSLPRRALIWIGGLAVLPCAITLALEFDMYRQTGANQFNGHIVLGYAGSFGLPLVLAWFLRKRDAWINVVAAIWVLALGRIAQTENVGLYLWCALGAAGMVAWGVRDGRSERVNIGMVGFALTLLFFYFSQIMDKLGRSASLIGLGLLFLAGGWALERLRRRLVIQAQEAG